MHPSLLLYEERHRQYLLYIYNKYCMYLSLYMYIYIYIYNRYLSVLSSEGRGEGEGRLKLTYPTKVKHKKM